MFAMIWSSWGNIRSIKVGFEHIGIRGHLMLLQGILRHIDWVGVVSTDYSSLQLGI